MISPEHAVEVCMKELGYKYVWDDRADERLWVKGNEKLDDEQALAMCEDLNRLGDIWHRKLRGFHDTHFERDFVYAVLDDHDPRKALIVVAEALDSLATAEALEERK